MKFNKKNIIWMIVSLSIYTSSNFVFASGFNTSKGLSKAIQANSSKLKYSPNRLIISYKNKKSFNTLSSQTKAMGLSSRVIASPAAGIISIVKIQKDVNLVDAYNAYKADPSVALVSYDYYRELYNTTPIGPPNDPIYTGAANRGVNEMWGLHDTAPDLTTLLPKGSLILPNTADKTIGNDIDAERAWEVWHNVNPSDIANVVVAVIDTGVDYTHPDLVDAMWVGRNATAYGIDTADGDNDPYPVQDDHGTHIAGTIAATANNGIGIPGIASGVKIMAIKVASDIAGSISDSSLISGINYAVENGADIINLSLGGPGPEDTVLTAAVKNAVDNGVLLVVAAGNSTQNNDQVNDWPSNYADFVGTASGVISVAATDQADLIANFSNFGARSVNLGAPGVNIKSTVTGLETKPENIATGKNIIPLADINLPDPFSGDATHLSCAVDPNNCFDKSFFSATTPKLDCDGINCTWGWIRSINEKNDPSLIVLGGNPAELNFDAGKLIDIPIYAESINGTITSKIITGTENKKTILSYYASWDVACNTDYIDVEVFDGANWILLLADNNEFNIAEGLTNACLDNSVNTAIPSQHTLTGRMASGLKNKFPSIVTPFPFVLISHDISLYSNQNLSVRFSFVTTTGVKKTIVPFGVILEDIKVSTQVTDYTNSYGYKSGTSMSAPHVAGIAALIKGANPTFTGAEIKTRLLESADANVSLIGKTTSGSRANAFNAISGSPGATLPPPPVQQNNSGSSGGCTLVSNAKFDPLFPSMLIITLLILLRKFKIKIKTT